MIGLLPLVAVLSNGGPTFDPRDPQAIRLWDGRAPGAIGDDPARDIPFLRVFPAPDKGPAILLIPGGGYDRLTNEKEQAPVARYFAERLHITTFLLTYRLVQPDGTYRCPVPLWDGQRALRLLRSRAETFRVDPARIIVFGFSAGGHLASTLALHASDEFGLPQHDSVDRASARVDLLGLGYPVVSMDPAAVPPSGTMKNFLKGFTGEERRRLEEAFSGEKHVGPNAPPTFLFESLDDARVSAQNSVLFVEALKKAGVSVEAHLYPHGQHGAGLANGIPEEENWPEAFRRWLRARGFLKP